MSEISHLIADPDTNAKLKACFPDFSLLKEQVKKSLIANFELVQALIISPEISDVPSPTRFLFLLEPSTEDRSQVSCRGYCYLGDRTNFEKYLKALLLTKNELDIDNPIYIASANKIDSAQIFSSLSLVELKKEISEREDNQITRLQNAPIKGNSRNYTQFAFIALILFAFVYGYTSQRAQVLINRTRDYVFGVTSLLTNPSEAKMAEKALESNLDLNQDLPSTRARFVGDVKTDDVPLALDPNADKDRIDILMSKLELLEDKEQATPAEVKQIEAEIDKALEALAEKEVLSRE